MANPRPEDMHPPEDPKVWQTIVYVKLDSCITEPVLKSEETNKIRKETGATVQICVGPYNNYTFQKRLSLNWEGYRIPYDVQMKAKYMALSFIYYNFAHPPGCGTPTFSADEIGRPPIECTSDEYVVDPDERNICVLHGPMVTTDEWTGKPPPDGYAGPRPNNLIIGPLRKFGNQI